MAMLHNQMVEVKFESTFGEIGKQVTGVVVPQLETSPLLNCILHLAVQKQLVLVKVTLFSKIFYGFNKLISF